MKRYLLRVNPVPTEPDAHPYRTVVNRMRAEKLTRQYYKEYVIPFAIAHNLNYKRHEWKFGISLQKRDLVALTLLLPTDAVLIQDSE